MAIEIGTTEGALCGAVTCGEFVCGEEGDFYELPDTLVFRNDSYKTRFREDDRLLSHGSHINGFAFEGRDVVVEGSVVSVDEATQRTLLRTIMQKSGRQDIKFRYDSTFYKTIARLKDADIVHEVLTGKVLTDLKLVWRAKDPFWYSSSYVQHVETVTGDDTFTVTVDESVFPDVSPTIQIAAPSVGSVGTLTLENTSDDESRILQYADTSLRDGASVTLDCRTAEASRGGTDTIRFVDGNWIRLLPGDNVISYTGGACTITITHQPRWT